MSTNTKGTDALVPQPRGACRTLERPSPRDRVRLRHRRLQGRRQDRHESLSIDHQMFVLARARELCDRGTKTKDGVFGTLSGRTLKQMGLGLAAQPARA